MKALPTKQVCSALRGLGFAPSSRGNGTSMTVWADGRGRTCRMSYSRTDFDISQLYRLAHELEGKGVCPRRDFMNAAQGR